MKYLKLFSLLGLLAALSVPGFGVDNNATAAFERLKKLFDGKDLVLEHYCMAGNQPKMRASGYNPQTGELQFDFVGVGNLSRPAAGYMHNTKFRFVDDDQLRSEWTFFEDGGAKFTETIQSRRVQ